MKVAETLRQSGIEILKSSFNIIEPSSNGGSLGLIKSFPHTGKKSSQQPPPTLKLCHFTKHQLEDINGGGRVMISKVKLGNGGTVPDFYAA
jgi:hypothetical protein